VIQNGPSKSIGRAVASGVSWLFAQSAGARIIGLVSQVVLARLLIPADFGLLGLAGTVTTVASVLVFFGLDDVMLQRQKTMRFWIAPAFWSSLVLGTLGMILILLAAPITARAYAAPELLSILSIMAVSLPLTGVATVYAAAIRARLHFHTLAIVGTLEIIAIQVLTIVLAMSGFGAYSFAIPIPIVAAARCITVWRLAAVKFRPFHRRQFWCMGFKSAAVFGTRLLTTIVGQADYFVLGLTANKAVVGVYYFAFRLAVQPVQMMAGNLSNVLFPALAQMRYDPTRQREAAIKASRFLAYIVTPYCFLQAAVAAPLLHWVFGAKWDSAIPIVQILSIGLGFDAVSWVAGSFLNAKGEFKRAFRYSCVFTPLFFLCVWQGATTGSATGVAIAVSMFYIIVGPLYFFLVFRRVGSISELMSVYLPSFLISVASIGSAYLLFFLYLPFGGHLLRIAMTAAIGVTLYVLILWAVAPETSRQMTARVRELFAGAQS